ncbi:hypothetical protein NP493_314g00012 [Ridgeia piscesae]|uniref:RING-type domain-containing protein n=1 Tax=Ridgeia piscesae TaxID=27915 RepID=A0AAD9NW10_RIDPI|nr:hypothetical protein NP493_314g00012 [Ridgeia piscesae]
MANEMRNTTLTPCGHRYCEQCIRECVNQHHKCPCCNARVPRCSDLIRDHQFDSLMKTVKDEKEIAEKTYFDRLIDSAGHAGSSGDETDSTKDNNLSTLELLLKKHLRVGLAAHLKYHQDLQKDFENRRHELEQKHREQIDKLMSKGFSAEETNRRLDELTAENDDQKRALESELTNCGQLLADTYDRYLSDHIPDLTVLPVKVTLTLLNKGIQIPDVVLQPHHSISDIKHVLEGQMLSRGDKIVEFGDDLTFVCFGPFSKSSVREMTQVARDLADGLQHPDAFVLPSHSLPVLQFAVKPGSVIALYGTVRCDSDRPKQCFAATFQQGSTTLQAVDYFTCCDCKFNCK